MENVYQIGDINNFLNKTQVSESKTFDTHKLSGIFSSNNLRISQQIRSSGGTQKTIREPRKRQKDYQHNLKLYGVKYRLPLRPNVRTPSKLTKYDERASLCLINHGVVALNGGKRILRRPILKLLLDFSISLLNEICNRLDELKISYVKSNSNSNRNISFAKRHQRLQELSIEYNHSFKFKEVSSRCLGRLDIRFDFDKYPHIHELIQKHSFWWPIIQNILGEEAILRYCGTVISFPGSCVQPWHGDGPHLFGKDYQCPMHAINVFIPLTEVTEEIGPTEFIPDSHILQNTVNIVTDSKGEIRSSQSIFKPLLEKGTALLYDYRTIHRGTSNQHPTNCRHMLYLLYTKPWFHEGINFGDISIFDSIENRNDVPVGKLKNEDRDCAGFCSLDNM